MPRLRIHPSLPVAALALALGVPAALAAETPVELAAGPGRDQVVAACGMCHSLDYIVMNSPFQDRAGWEKTVRKMVNVMGAPLTDAEVRTIVDYLGTYYSAAAQ